MKKKNILSLVGGGARGLALAVHLEAFERNVLKEPIRNHFDAFAGTSTGAIIAAMLSCGYSITDVKKLYIEHGEKIFNKPFWRTGLLFGNKYPDKYFNAILQEKFRGVTLRDLGRQLIVPAYNTSKRETVIFNSEDRNGGNFFISDIVRASASAPTYFDPWLIDGETYVDGGLAINNPSLVSVFEAIKEGGEHINVLSFGTGRSEESLNKDQLSKGLIRNAGQLFDIVLDEQAKIAAYQTHEAFDKLRNQKGEKIGAFLHVEGVIRNGSGAIDDFSPANVEAMKLDGLAAYNLSASELRAFCAYL